MSEFLAKNLLGNMTLVLTNKLFKSPLGLFFECYGIARAVPIIINETKVYLDFHIYAILEFDLLIGYPVEKLFQVKPSDGSLDEKLGITTSATLIPCPISPMAKHIPNHDPFEEAKFISPFISPRPPSETEHPLSTSLDLEPCPSGYPDIILKKDNLCAMDIPKAPTLETKKKDFDVEHESFFFETPHASCSRFESRESIVLSAACSYKDHNHLLILVIKLFTRMVVDVFIYHKCYRSRSSTVTLTLQLE
jgi:hypothetical protein